MSELKAALDEARNRLDSLTEKERNARLFIALSAETVVALYPNDPNLAMLREDVQQYIATRKEYNDYLRDVYSPAMDAYYESIGVFKSASEVSDV